MTSRSVPVLVLMALLTAPAPAVAASEPWAWPLERHDVGERFDPPADRYSAGHRGIDLAGTVGDPVHATAAGRVSFAGRVGGVPAVTVDHGRESSTYQPVEAVVRIGDAVDARQVIGTLAGTGSHCTGACLHLGRRDGDDYLDPLELLREARFRLISPSGRPPEPPAAVGGGLVRPVGGPVTSPFGMRVHPITGVRSLHDGTDFGVPCGTPVHAAAGGIVTRSAVVGPYGQQVTIRLSSGTETSYSHLSARRAQVGSTVRVGDLVGLVGSTGRSTGCHLHFMVLVDGSPVDPMPLL